MAKYMDTPYYLVVNKNDYVVATFFRQSEAERYAMNRAELGYRGADSSAGVGYQQRNFTRYGTPAGA